MYTCFCLHSKTSALDIGQYGCGTVFAYVKCHMLKPSVSLDSFLNKNTWYYDIHGTVTIRVVNAQALDNI